jgi:hypothetical protein
MSSPLGEHTYLPGHAQPWRDIDETPQGTPSLARNSFTPPTSQLGETARDQIPVRGPDRNIVDGEPHVGFYDPATGPRPYPA